MEVKISITEGATSVTSDQGQGAAGQGTGEQPGATPPADLAARASAMGASSAGPAPTSPAVGGAPPLPSVAPGTPSTPAIGPEHGASSDISAGAAAAVAAPEGEVMPADVEDDEAEEEDEQ